MPGPWEKKFSFRLQAQDEDLLDFLENLPSNQRSRVIRNMLRFAYDYSLEVKKQNEALEKLLGMMKELADGQERIMERIGRINAVPVTDTTPENRKKEQTDRALRESAMAFLNMFGQD